MFKRSMYQAVNPIKPAIRNIVKVAVFASILLVLVGVIPPQAAHAEALPPGPDSLGPDQQLGRDQWLTSPNGRYMLYMQYDGNLVLETTSRFDYGVIWASNTDGSGAVRVVMQRDGNLVLYREDNTAVWASHTVGGVSVLRLQNDDNLVIYRLSGKAVWQTGAGTHQTSTTGLIRTRLGP